MDGKVYAKCNAILRYVGGLGTARVYQNQLKVDEMVELSEDMVKDWEPAFYMNLKGG